MATVDATPRQFMITVDTTSNLHGQRNQEAAKWGGLTEKGKEIARLMAQDIEKKYGKIIPGLKVNQDDMLRIYRNRRGQESMLMVEGILQLLKFATQLDVSAELIKGKSYFVFS